MSDMDPMEEEMYDPDFWNTTIYGSKKPPQRNNETITQFLGESPLAVDSYFAPPYYGELLAWSVKRVTTGWKTVSVLGYRFPEPLYSDVQTDYETRESCLGDGEVLLIKEDVRLVITFTAVCCLQIQASLEHHEVVKKLLQDIKDYMQKNNFYRGKKVSFDGRLSFLNVGQKDWDSVILDPEVKEGIRLNTVGFLRNISRMQEYGIPPKRGIILAGDPGTGKTIVCKAIMAEAEGITCINTTAYAMGKGEYFSDLYGLAQDLSPSMVFIEDIDFFGQERQESYRGNPAFLTLLAEMDGITEKTAIVTVATSNCFEKLDKALSERPSRFDRVFQIPRPNYCLRLEILKKLARKIPLSEEDIEYIAKKTDGFTPAQVQEVPFSLVNTRLNKGREVMDFSRQDVDVVIFQMNHKKTSGGIGFTSYK